MPELFNTLYALAESLPPITLQEMSSIRLMNRTDTKFVTDIPRLVSLLQQAQGSYYAQRAGGKCVSPYATTYFDDTARHTMFRTHQCGHRPRTKVRVRTYVDANVSFLEVKRKNNHGKTHKKRVQVPSLDAVLGQQAGEEFVRELTGLTFANITPTLSNRFKRITLVNKQLTERLTIDFDLHFFNHETQARHAMPGIAIIELKRDGRQPSPILPVLRTLRIRPSGFSKYCIGSALTNTELRQNRFKKRIHRISKIENRSNTDC